MTDINRIVKNARDALVGKLPNPQSQVEQITIALIYKFMDAKDKDHKTYGVDPTFFVDEYENYSFSRVINETTNMAKMNLYRTGLEKMSTNTKLPDLFRSIFKNAYLPYNDANTFWNFISEIDKMPTHNTEVIGTAFEDLLSIMGSQGDAGQFRTPRHLIDFMTEVIKPQKNEKVLDPACGSAGFLISAYNYIMKQNNYNLTFEEKREMEGNFRGYDISYEMVRLANVNMFLHSFDTPQIFENDTLTEERFWEDKFDVILANPPFMTPRGGIKPNKFFSEITANRSEVLFAYYINKHLNKNGRAGIIVPDGVVFQTNNSYKHLRKILLDESLYAVVSLPSGVFNPYSGVKTSILFLDKILAKKASKILFLNMQSDGFNLGSQRSDLGNEGDIPEFITVLENFKKCIKTDKAFQAVEGDKIIVASKQEIIDNDYVLVGNRYKKEIEYDAKYPMVKLSEILKYEQPTKYIVESTNYSNEHKTPVLTAGQSFILGYTNEENGIMDDLPTIIFDDFTTAFKYVDFPFKVKSSAMKILNNDKNKTNLKYIFYAMQGIKFDASLHKRFWISQYSEIKIPLPRLELQNKIAEELEGYQKVIIGANQILENYKPIIKIDPAWKKIKLEDCLKPFKYKEKMLKSNFLLDGKFPVIDQSLNFIAGFSNDEKLVNKIVTPVICFGDHTLAVKYVDFDFVLGADGVKVLLPKNNVNPKYLYYYLKNFEIESRGYSRHYKYLKELNISLPSLEVQQKIVKDTEQDENYVNSCKILIEKMKSKIDAKIADIWGEEK
jgi:type I restriction enzyme M protein